MHVVFVFQNSSLENSDGRIVIAWQSFFLIDFQLFLLWVRERFQQVSVAHDFPLTFVPEKSEYAYLHQVAFFIGVDLLRMSFLWISIIFSLVRNSGRTTFGWGIFPFKLSSNYLSPSPAQKVTSLSPLFTKYSTDWVKSLPALHPDYLWFKTPCTLSGCFFRILLRP